MFSAVGTVSFEKMKFDLMFLAGHLLEGEGSVLSRDEDVNKLEKQPYDEQIAGIQRTHLKLKFIHLWLMVQFLNSSKCVFSSPNGETLAPAPSLVEHHIVSRYVGCSFPLEQSSLISIIDKFLNDGYGDANIDPFAYFYFIDHQAGLICNQLDGKTPFHFIEGLEDYFPSRVKVEKSAGIAKQFEGWAVSFQSLDEFEGKGFEYLLDWLRLDYRWLKANSIEPLNEPDIPDSKSPRSVNTETAVYNFFMAYMNKYPEDNPPKEKARLHFGKLNNGDIIGERAWIRIWDKVAAQHTHISVSGRKPDWTAKQFEWNPEH